MDIKYELLANTLSDVVHRRVEQAFDDLKEWSDATAMVMLFEIREILTDENISDYDAVEKIREIYKKYNVNLKK